MTIALGITEFCALLGAPAMLVLNRMMPTRVIHIGKKYVQVAVAFAFVLLFLGCASGVANYFLLREEVTAAKQITNRDERVFYALQKLQTTTMVVRIRKGLEFVPNQSNQIPYDAVCLEIAAYDLLYVFHADGKTVTAHELKTLRQTGGNQDAYPRGLLKVF